MPRKRKEPDPPPGPNESTDALVSRILREIQEAAPHQRSRVAELRWYTPANADAPEPPFLPPPSPHADRMSPFTRWRRTHVARLMRRRARRPFPRRKDDTHE